jgi:hypothetical protein
MRKIQKMSPIFIRFVPQPQESGQQHRQDSGQEDAIRRSRAANGRNGAPSS